MLCLTGVGSAWGEDFERNITSYSDLNNYITQNVNKNPSNRYTINITANCSGSTALTIAANANLTLNIAEGVTITFTNNADIFLTNSGNLTIGGKGSIISSATTFATILNSADATLHIIDGNYQGVRKVIDNKGNLVIDNGNFTATNTVVLANIGCIVNSYANAISRIYGGYYNCNLGNNSTKITSIYGAIAVAAGKAYIYGGVFDNEAKNESSGQYAKCIDKADASTLEIYGGVFMTYYHRPNDGGLQDGATRYTFEGETPTFAYNNTDTQLVPATIVGKNLSFSNKQLTAGTCTFDPSLYEIDGKSLVADGYEAQAQGTTWEVVEATSKTYKIKFVNNTDFGGTPDDISGQTTIPDNLPDYAEDDYHIVWYTNKARTTPAVAGTRISKIVGLEVDIITLYAKWEQAWTIVSTADEFNAAIGGKSPIYIKLNNDISNLSAFSIVEGKEVHIDFYGHKVTTTASPCITVNGNLYLTDNNNGEGGITSSNNSLMVTNPGSYLEVNTGKYQAYSGVADIGGEAIINDGTFTATNTPCIRANKEGSNVTINGGTFSSSTRTIWCTAAGAEINIYGGRITGRIDNSAGLASVYGCLRNNVSCSFTTKGKSYSINGSYYLLGLKPDESKDVTIVNNKITAGTFSFDPSLPIYNIDGQSLVADGYTVTEHEATEEEPYHKTWVVTKDVIIDKNGHEVNPASWDGSDNNFGIYEGETAEIRNKVNVFHKTGENTYVCNNLTLTDGKDFALPDALDNKTLAAAKVTYTRNVTINTEKYTTVCLPYSFPTDGLKVMEFGSFENGVLTFSPVEETVPGKPYLIRVADNGTEMTSVNFSTSTETALSAAETEAQFVGTYNKVQLSSDVSTTYYGYSSANNEFRRIATSNCPAFRAYLQIATVAGARTAISINFGDDATGIENAIVETGDNAAPIYTLNGVRVEKPTKAGIYVQGGRKIIVNK